LYFIVNCGDDENNWKFNHSKSENHQGYLKSNDIINLYVKKMYDDNGHPIQNGQVEFLCSHDIQFTIGDYTFQEVFCHNERLGGNDEVSNLICLVFILLRFVLKKKNFFFSFY